MKRFLAILLCCAMTLTGCAVPSDKGAGSSAEMESVRTDNTQEVSFTELSDPELIPYVEENIYNDLLSVLSSKEYFVENVSAIYISDEYLEEIKYNSQKNIYFGYTLKELNECFQDTRYVFTLGDDGKTTVQPFEAYDDTFEQIVQNVAVGTGIILICITISSVTVASAPAVSAIFAASAQSGTTFALSSGTFSALATGIVTGIQTKDFDETIKTAALSGSEGFKWGAITGVLDGGITHAAALKGAAMNGLTMNQAAQIQRESKLPLSFIKSFHSVEEYNVYKRAGLRLTKVNGKWTYMQDIDWNLIDSEKRTNLERVSDGLAPIDAEGKSFELHHIGQKADSPLAILTHKQHHSNDSILHNKNVVSQIDRSAFNAEKKEFWKTLASAE